MLINQQEQLNEILNSNEVTMSNVVIENVIITTNEINILLLKYRSVEIKKSIIECNDDTIKLSLNYLTIYKSIFKDNDAYEINIICDDLYSAPSIQIEKSLLSGLTLKFYGGVFNDVHISNNKEFKVLNFYNSAVCDLVLYNNKDLTQFNPIKKIASIETKGNGFDIQNS